MTSSVEERLSRLEGSYEQISERLNDLNQIVQGVDRKVDALRSDIDARFDSLRSDMDMRLESMRAETNTQFRELNSRLDEMNRSQRNFSYVTYAIGSGIWATIVVGAVMIMQNA